MRKVLLLHKGQARNTAILPPGGGGSAKKEMQPLQKQHEKLVVRELCIPLGMGWLGLLPGKGRLAEAARVACARREGGCAGADRAAFCCVASMRACILLPSLCCSSIASCTGT